MRAPGLDPLQVHELRPNGRSLPSNWDSDTCRTSSLPPGARSSTPSPLHHCRTQIPLQIGPGRGATATEPPCCTAESSHLPGQMPNGGIHRNNYHKPVSICTTTRRLSFPQLQHPRTALTAPTCNNQELFPHDIVRNISVNGRRTHGPYPRARQNVAQGVHSIPGEPLCKGFRRSV